MANTNAGRKFYFCTTPQPVDIDITAAAALTYVEVKGIGDFGQTGPQTNILNYPTWDTTVVQKAKGTTDAGSPTLTVARIPDDPGQVALRAAAATNLNYMIKTVYNDAPAAVAPAVGTPTTTYNRGLVTGPTRPNGKNEDFDIEIYTFALQMLELVAQAAAA